MTPTYTVVLNGGTCYSRPRSKIRLQADKNSVASKPTNTPTGPHKAEKVTPTYTVVLLLLWREVS